MANDPKPTSETKTCNALAAQPFHINVDVTDVGHTFVLAPTRSGMQAHRAPAVHAAESKIPTQTAADVPPSPELHPPPHASSDECSYSLGWAEVLAAALDNDDAQTMARHYTAAADVYFSMVDELRRLAATQPKVRPHLARVLRMLHQDPDSEDAVLDELLDELSTLARENCGDERVTAEYAIALANTIEDLVLRYEIKTAAALLPQLRFERIGYVLTSESIDARVRALAAVYRALRSPDLLDEMRWLHGSGSYASRARFGQVLIEGKEAECADLLATLVQDLEWPGTCFACGTKHLDRRQ